MTDKLKVIGLLGGPGTGKSTTAAGLYWLMKTEGDSVELVTEFAKDLTWEGRTFALQDQLYILAKQNLRLSRLVGQVEWAITDSPLMLCTIYSKLQEEAGKLIPEAFFELVEDVEAQYEMHYVYLARAKPYWPVGRNQTEDEAHEIDRRVINFLVDREIDYDSLRADNRAPLMIYNRIVTPWKQAKIAGQRTETLEWHPE